MMPRQWPFLIYSSKQVAASSSKPKGWENKERDERTEDLRVKTTLRWGASKRKLLNHPAKM